MTSEIVAARAADLYVCANYETGPHVGSDPRQCPVCHSHVQNLGKLLDPPEKEDAA